MTVNLDFMPSRQLAWYVAKLFLTRSLAVLVALVLVLMALDVLGESSKILAVPGNGEAEIWRYVSLRLPILISRFLPFSVLLGTLIAMTGLNASSEVVAMKSAGLSAHQILAPMVVASLGVAALTFAFNETMVVKANRVITAWSDARYQPIPPDTGILSNVWLRRPGEMIRAERMTGTGAATRLEGVTIYRVEGHSLLETIDARVARPVGGDASGAKGWRLEQVRRFAPGQPRETVRAGETAMIGVAAETLRLTRVDPDALNILDLGDKIRRLEASDRPSDEARTGWWHKLSGPLSAVLMPLLAALAAFGLARSGQVLMRAATGMALGFTYFVVDNLSVALGNTGAYPPFLAAWAPFILFFLIGETVLIRTEE